MPPNTDIQAYLDEIAAWRAQMDQRIRAENSWLALSALLWLHQGDQHLQRTEQGDFRFSEGVKTGWLGTFSLNGEQIWFQPNPELDLRINGQPADRTLLASDVDPEPDFIEFQNLRFVVVRRGARLGLRIWDNDRPERTSYPERSWFPIDPEMRLDASLREIAPGRKILIPDVLGDSTEEDVFGEIEFNFAGETFRLQALEAGEDQAFVIFADLTNGRSTYSGGRFLTVNIGDPEDMKIDFNRAFNPPCAFTPYATCPLPPPANHLPVEIPAGERFPRSESHASSHRS